MLVGNYQRLFQDELFTNKDMKTDFYNKWE